MLQYNNTIIYSTRTMQFCGWYTIIENLYLRQDSLQGVTSRGDLLYVFFTKTCIHHKITCDWLSFL